jgi:hypothetical protein
MPRYCSVQDVADLAGRDFSGLEQHVTSQVIAAAEAWIDSRLGRSFGLATVTERLTAAQDSLYLSSIPVQDVVTVEVRTRTPGDVYTDLGDAGDGWELIDSSLGLLSVPGMNGLEVFVEYIPEQSVPALLREAARRLTLLWLRPNLLDVPPGTVTYRAGADISVSFDQKAIPAEIITMIDAVGGGRSLVPFA